ncbi:putative nucleotidyltransferase, ribonuclease H [Tanacetum coccineum]
MWSQVPISYDKHALCGISHWGRKQQQFYEFAVNRESARDIMVHRDNDKLYTFKEGNFNRLRIQDIEDMLLLLVQGKLTNLTVEERLAFNVSLRISDLKRREAYSAYSNPRGFIYQNKYKKNILMRIDELHKFSDGTLNDVRTALDDRLKGIRMKHLPQTIWRQSDRDKARAMIHAIDKQLKTRRIMLSLEKFVGGRPYEGDFWLLQWTCLNQNRVRPILKQDSQAIYTGERILEGPEMIEVTNEKVAVAREKLKEAQTRQKSYADRHRRALEFQPGEHVFLKVSPTRGVRRFGIKGKLSPRFIGPFEILDRVGEVSYRLALPPQLSHVHNVFHVSLLRGYKYHPLHVVSYPFDQIREDLSYTEEPESILDRQDRVMRNKTIPFVKILWRNHPEREATWETEESIRTSYPHFLP